MKSLRGSHPETSRASGSGQSSNGRFVFRTIADHCLRIFSVVRCFRRFRVLATRLNRLLESSGFYCFNLLLGLVENGLFLFASQDCVGSHLGTACHPSLQSTNPALTSCLIGHSHCQRSFRMLSCPTRSVMGSRGSSSSNTSTKTSDPSMLKGLRAVMSLPRKKKHDRAFRRRECTCC